MAKLKVGDKMPHIPEGTKFTSELGGWASWVEYYNCVSRIVKKVDEKYYYFDLEYIKDNYLMCYIEDIDELIPLPKNWYVKVTKENIKILSEWIGSINVEVGGIVGMVLWDDDVLEKGYNDGHITKSKRYNFGQEITFEQFKHEVLSMKPIIEYRVKPEYNKFSRCLYDAFSPSTNGGWARMDGDSTLVDSYRKAGVLDLWFEPVYEEEFKVGDWVVIEECGYGTSVEDVGIICQIVSTQIAGLYNIEIDRDKKGNNNRFTEAGALRKATPEEIEKAQTKTFKVGDFEVAVKGGKAWHKNDNITQFVKDLYSYYNNFNFDLKKTPNTHYSFKAKDIIFSETGCEKSESKLSEWLQVYNALT